MLLPDGVISVGDALLPVGDVSLPVRDMQPLLLASVQSL